MDNTAQKSSSLEQALTLLVNQVSKTMFNPNPKQKQLMVDAGLLDNLDDTTEKVSMSYIIAGHKVRITIFNETLTVDEGGK